MCSLAKGTYESSCVLVKRLSQYLIYVGKRELCKFYYWKDYSLSLHKEVQGDQKVSVHLTIVF